MVPSRSGHHSSSELPPTCHLHHGPPAPLRLTTYSIQFLCKPPLQFPVGAPQAILLLAVQLSGLLPQEMGPCTLPAQLPTPLTLNNQTTGLTTSSQPQYPPPHVSQPRVCPSFQAAWLHSCLIPHPAQGRALCEHKSRNSVPASSLLMLAHCTGMQRRAHHD